MPTSNHNTFVLAILWIALLLIGFVLTTYSAFVLRTMWEWFVVPAGFQPLSKALSIGILLIVGLLKWPSTTGDDDNDADTAPVYRAIYKTLVGFVFVSFCWGSAAIWHFYLL